MWTKNDKLKCDICSKFIGWNPHYVWTPFGNSQQEEPPEDEHAHKNCYEELNQSELGLIVITSWQKPFLNLIDTR